MLLLSLITLFHVFILGVTGSPEAIELSRLTVQAPDGIIRITDGDLSSFTGVRDYHTLVFLTSSEPQHRCGACGPLMEAARPVARTWTRDYLSTMSLFFVEIDLVHAGNQELAAAINLDTIPHAWLVPPNPHENYDPYAILKESHFIFRLPKGNPQQQTLQLASFVSENLKKSIILYDEDPVTTFGLYFLVTFLAIMLFKKRGPRIIVNLGKKVVYKFLAIGMILVSTTGFNFVRMKHIPFIARNEHGIVYISGGQYYQFGVETVLVSMVYTVLAACLLGLIYVGRYRVHSQSSMDENTKAVLIVVISGLVYFFYSCLTSIVLRKDPEYPYGFSRIL